MRPNFALNLSLDGIDLFHRSKTGWSHVGTVSLDDPDLGAALAVLRSTAVSLDRTGLTTKVVIPDSQILYTEVPVEGEDDAGREAAIRRALDGRTPYAIEDLVFDWRLRGDTAELAVVARETLAEAEAFARDHRFNPICFAATALDDRFGGSEPFFGPAEGAADLIAAHGSPERDSVALAPEALKQAPMAEPEALPPEALSEEANAPAGQAALPDELPAKADLPPTPAAEDLTPEPVAEAAAVPPAPMIAAETLADPAPAQPELVGFHEVAPTFASRRQAAAGKRKAEAKPVEPQAGATTETGPEAAAAPNATAAPRAEAEAGADTPKPAEAKAAKSRAPAVGKPAVKPPARSDRPGPRLVASTEAPAAPNRPAPVAPRRNNGPMRPPADAPAAVKAFARNQGNAARKSPVVDIGALRAFKGRDSGATALQIAPEPELDDIPPMPAIAGRPSDSNFNPRRPAPARSGSPAVRIVLLTLALLLVLAALALWSTFWGRGDDSQALAPEPAAPASQSGEQTGAAAPDPEAAADGAATGDYYPPEADPAAADAPAADSTPEADPQADPQNGPPQDGAAADPALPADPARTAFAGATTAPALPADAALPATGPETGTQTGTQTGTDAGSLAAADDIADGVQLAALPDAAPAAANPAASDPAADEPQVDEEALADGEPDAYLDPAPETAAPEAQAADPADAPAEDLALAQSTPVPATPSLPQDPVTELVATDKGAAERVREQLAAELTPELAQSRYDATGIWVMSPEPPADAASERNDDIYLAAADPAVKAEDAVALPTLRRPDAALKPLPNPAPAGTVYDLDANGLVKPTPQGAMNPDGIVIYQGRPPVAPRPRDGGANVPATAQPAAAPAPALPKLHPKARPADLAQTVEKAQLGGRTRETLAGLRPLARPASVVAAAEAAQPAVTAPASEHAVASSPLPRIRPAEIVALASVQRNLRPPPAPAPAAAAPAPEPAPPADSHDAEADGEPEVASVRLAPTLPSKASVTKNATEKNVLNLSKVNLIGVFGGPSDRRALVRLGSGKYVKVKVGDRLEGGKVAAISESTLVYVKGGRENQLALPKI